jgi:pimeloyl-ACP methyl ester carboxylesterase
VLGFGASPFSPERSAPCHFEPRALVDAVLAWLDVLSLRDMPTVMAGHSISAASLLSVTDEDVGDQVGRVALTPIFPGEHAQLRRTLAVSSVLLRALGRFDAVRRHLGRYVFVHAPSSAGYRLEERRSMHEKFMQVPSPILAAIYRGIARARPAPSDRLERCAVIIGKDDPLAPTMHVLDVLRRLKFPERNIHHLASGGHQPYADDEHNPGFSVRNAHDIARIIESMLLSSREGTPSTTAVESTMMATSSLHASASRSASEDDGA